MMLLLLFLLVIIFKPFKKLQTFYFIHTLAVLPITKLYLSPTHSVVKSSYLTAFRQ